MKHHKRVMILFVILLLFSQATLLAQGNNTKADVSFQKKIELTIREKNDSEYTCDAKVSFSIIYLSERSKKITTHTVDQSYFTPIKNLKAQFRSNTIPKENILLDVPYSGDVFVSDSKTYYISIPEAISSGDKFTCSYDQTFKETEFLPLFFIPNTDSVVEYRLSVKHPEELKVSFELFFPNDSIPYTVLYPDEDQTELVFNNVGRNKELQYFPFDEYQAAISIGLQKEGKSVVAGTPKTFFEWYSKKTSVTPRLDSSSAQALAETLRTVPSPLAKLKIIHDFVRSSIRYIADERGMNAVVPRLPSETLRKKYGDCKDRAALVSAIAREQGIDVSLVIVGTSPSPKFSTIHPWMFDHMICAYTERGKTIFFDPTAQYCEFGNLPQNDIGALAFILDAGNPVAVEIPAPEQKPSLEIAIHVKVDSQITGTADIILRNDYASSARHAEHDLTQQQWKNYLESLISSNLYQIRLDSFQVVSEGYDSILLSSRADLSKFFVISGTRIYVPQVPFLTFDNQINERQKDSLPLYFEERTQLRLTLSLDAPGYALKQAETTRGNASKGFVFESKAKETARQKQFSYLYKQTNKKMYGKDKEEFLSFHKEYLKFKKNMYQLERNLK